MKLLKLLLILSTISLFVNTAFAKNIGRISKIKGDVFYGVKGNIKRSQLGANVKLGDTLITGVDSYVKVIMKDDTIFQMGSHTKFVFENFEFKTKKERKAIYKLLRGKLRSLFTVKAKNRDLIIKTPTVSMAVKGTEILSDVYKVGNDIKTDVALLSGKLELRKPDGINADFRRVIMRPGQLVTSTVGIGGNIVRHRLGKIPRELFNRIKSKKNQKDLFFNTAKPANFGKKGKSSKSADDKKEEFEFEIDYKQGDKGVIKGTRKPDDIGFDGKPKNFNKSIDGKKENPKDRSRDLKDDDKGKSKSEDKPRRPAPRNTVNRPKSGGLDISSDGSTRGFERDAHGNIKGIGTPRQQTNPGKPESPTPKPPPPKKKEEDRELGPDGKPVEYGPDGKPKNPGNPGNNVNNSS